MWGRPSHRQQRGGAHSLAPPPPVTSSMKRMILPLESVTSLMTAFSRSSNSPRYLAPEGGRGEREGRGAGRGDGGRATALLGTRTGGEDVRLRPPPHHSPFLSAMGAPNSKCARLRPPLSPHPLAARVWQRCADACHSRIRQGEIRDSSSALRAQPVKRQKKHEFPPWPIREWQASALCPPSPLHLR